MKFWETLYNVRFFGPLRIVEVEQNPQYWVVTEEYAVVWEDAAGETHKLAVPQWYVTDFASTGPARWLIGPMDEDIRKGSPPHDRAYESHEISQRTADALLYYSMRKRRDSFLRELPTWLRRFITWARALAAWIGVRTFGRRPYDSGPTRRDERQLLATPYINQAAEQMAVVETIIPEAATSKETIVTTETPATAESPEIKKAEFKN